VKPANRRLTKSCERQCPLMRWRARDAMAMAVVTLIFWLIGTERSSAEFLQENQAVNAQIAHGFMGRPDDFNVDRSDGSFELGVFEKRIQALIPDADRNCLPITNAPLKLVSHTKTGAQSSLETAVRQVKKSEIGAWLVEAAIARDVIICLDHATSLEAHYRSHLHLIGLSARLRPAGLVVFLAHELAHVPQHPHFSNNRRFSPGDMLLLQRLREAAAEAVATRVLWQLRQNGIIEPWQEKLSTAYHDIADAFEMTMAGRSGVVPELWATRSAFYQWFEASWRLETYDKLMLNTLARIADDPVGLIPTSRFLSDPFLRRLAHYAGQGFLMSGDGDAVIKRFRARPLQVANQARLDAILAKAETAITRIPYSLTSETLSAISPPATVTPEN